MARTELPNGIILPAEYSDDWYDDMTSNLSKLDEVIGSDAEKLSDEDVGAAALSNDYTDLDNKPDLKPVATSGDYDDLDNKPDLKPVATSGDYDDLDNKPDLKPVATSGDYDDLTDLPTYGITRYCSSAITNNSSVAFSAISSTNKIKVGDFLLDTVGKLYQISSVDTANETVSVTTPLTQLAVDSGVMHLSGNETADGLKTFLKYITSDGSSIGDEYSGNSKTNLWLMGNRDNEDVSGILFDSFRQNIAQGTGTHILGIGIKENGIRYEGCRFGWSWDNNLNGYTFDFKPTMQGTNQAVEHNLGTSTDKWDTINGINPGSLSLPDLNNGIDISGYLTLGSYVQNTYTPPVDGFISIMIYGSIANGLWIYSGDFGTGMRSIGGHPTYEQVSVVALPVMANVPVTIEVIVTGTSNNIGWAKFYPCLGNV